MIDCGITILYRYFENDNHRSILNLYRFFETIGIKCSMIVVNRNENLFEKIEQGCHKKLYEKDKELKIMRMEIRPQEGGKDAELFVEEFAEAVAKHSGKSVAQEGTMRFLERL